MFKAKRLSLTTPKNIKNLLLTLERQNVIVGCCLPVTRTLKIKYGVLTKTVYNEKSYRSIFSNFYFFNGF